MFNTKFPAAFGDKIFDLITPQDSGKIGTLQLCEVDDTGKVLNILFELKDGGGHVEVSRHALQDTEGYETEDVGGSAFVVVHQG